MIVSTKLYAKGGLRMRGNGGKVSFNGPEEIGNEGKEGNVQLKAIESIPMFEHYSQQQSQTLSPWISSLLLLEKNMKV